MAVERRRTGRLHPSGRSVSGGRRQPSLLPREECGTAAGEEGRRSRCRSRRGCRQTSHKRGRKEALPAQSEATGTSYRQCPRDTFGTSGIICPSRQNLRSEPFRDPRLYAYQPHIRSPPVRPHHHPAFGGKGSGVDETHLDVGMQAKPQSGRPPGSGRADLARPNDNRQGAMDG